MLDETIVTETPPIYQAYGRIGQQKTALITGNRTKRIIHGAINIISGDIELLITKEWNQDTPQDFLTVVRSHWRGWHIVLFEDKISTHTSEESKELAKSLDIELRFLPTASPELNAMDQIWKHMKRDTLANRSTCTIDLSAMIACRYVIDLSRKERLRKSGALSDDFWLL